MNVVFIHIGLELPDYLFSSLYQTLLLNEYKSKIYVIIDDTTIDTFNSKISEFSFNYYTKSHFNHHNIINVIPLSMLDMELSNNITYSKYVQTITDRFQNISQFRDGFWVSTTSRFFYICALMKMLNITNVFHIENDIMMYENFESLYNTMCNYFKKDVIDKICMIEDSPKRVIPSLLFFPNYGLLNILTQYITNELSYATGFLNDMDILGSFPDRLDLPLMPTESSIIFDGAALGQYLGGVDYKNLPNSSDPITRYNNPSKGFINETAVIKANDYYFAKSRVNLQHLRVPINIPTLSSKAETKVPATEIRIANLHIHSKQLYQFSSVSDIDFNDIISGDRILSLCDFVLLTRPIYEFHKNIEKYAKDVIIIRDFNNINTQLLNSYFRNHCRRHRTSVVKLFIYTHMLDDFQKFILPILDPHIDYHLYLHNSDHAFTDKHISILHSNHIKKIYAQNLDFKTSRDISDKLTLLPIGIANSMWKHGDILELYKTKSEIYRKKKYKSIYVNINPNTYFYRKTILDKIMEDDHFSIASNKPYTQYLQELAQYRFCLCIRGNGIDTHRFWESLYLGVIPVIINNKTTQCDNFIKYLHKLKIPFYEITEDNVDIMFEKYTNDFFSEDLAISIITSLSNSSIYSIPSLKLSFYK